MDETVSYHFATVKQRRENRHEIDYQLTLRQQPKQSRMCGVGEKADRRPIDPPPIVQLKIVDSSLPIAEKNSYLQNPYYFMYASLMAADLDEELHLLRDGKTRSTTGSVVSSLYHLKDIDNTDAGFFVFPDLSVRMEGSYRLKLSLFEIIGKEVFHCRSIISNKFFVYSAKKFPGMEESTFLSRSFADQGLKIRIRKELRQRRKLSKISDIEENENGSVTSTNTITNTPTTSTSTVPNSTTTTTTTTTTPSKKSHVQGGKRARVLQNNDSKQATWTPPIIEHNTRFYSTSENNNNHSNNTVLGTDRPYYEHLYENDHHHSYSNSNSNSSSSNSSHINHSGFTTQQQQPHMLDPIGSPMQVNQSPYTTTTPPLTTTNTTTSSSTINTPTSTASYRPPNQLSYYYHQNYPPSSSSSQQQQLFSNQNQLPPPPQPPSHQQPHQRY